LPRPPLTERMSLSEAGIKNGTKVQLEEGVAPKANQITLTYSVTGDSLAIGKTWELIVEKDCAIKECILQMVELSGNNYSEGWHLRKTNWEGDGMEALENPTLSLEAENIGDGDHLLLEEGVVPPKGFLRLPVWLLFPIFSKAESTVEENDSKIETNHQTNESSFILLQQKVFLGYLELTQETTLVELKENCLRLVSEKNSERDRLSEWPSVADKTKHQIRISTIDAKGIQGSALKGNKATLKILHLTDSVKLLVSVLEKSEDPSPSQIILRTYLRHSETRSYVSKGEVLWETAGAGATAASLRTAVAKELNLPSSELILAKYFPGKYEWMILTDAKQQTSIKKQYGKHASKKANGKKNLRQSPFFIQDGDIIGVKTLCSDPLHNDDFMTEYDERGKQQLKEQDEEKRKKRQEQRQRNNSESENVVGGKNKVKQQERKSKPEVALTIHVPKYE